MVTVIIPIYNQLKYVKRSIDSVIDQIYSDLQIILVNDGSTDGSADVCDEYLKKDSRITVIHKANGGLSSARNAGLEVAQGEYITFLDSDDYLSKTFIKHSIEMCEKHNADISVMDMIYIDEEMNDEIEDNLEEKVFPLSPKKAIEASLYQNLFSCCAPGKLYKKHIFEDIRFPLKKLSEDLAISHRLLNKANKIIYSNLKGYYYRQQQKSIMHIFNPSRLDAIQWAHDIEKFCEDNYPDIIVAAKCRTFNIAIHLLLDISKNSNFDKNFSPILWKDIKRTRKTVLLCRTVRFREKAAAILSFGGSTILRNVWNSRLAIKKF
ncbi:glycosyltransferase family 2 protein [Lacrimispora sp. BS-2]|uniref:Glycosyltransferase family 2 protein n=1 Tax=Lacrimispora sp. BS-2 TaxID=3151850 RepID=A0AAU7PNX4_9FIRM